MNKDINKRLKEDYCDLDESIQVAISEVETLYTVNVTYKDISGLISSHPQVAKLFENYYAHSNKFCSFLKIDTTFCYCVKSQDRLIDKLNLLRRPIYGSCYMGMEEFYFPVFLYDHLIGIYFVGSFCSDEKGADQKIEKWCREYKINEEDGKRFFHDVTRKVDFDYLALQKKMNEIVNMSALYYANIIGGNQASEEKDDIDVADLKNTILSKALKYIKHNYYKKITLKKIAEECYCNPNYLSNLFIKKMNQTFADHLNSIRILRAKELLRTTNMPIERIATKTGYSYYAYFSSTFKKYTGQTPSEYRHKL